MATYSTLTNATNGTTLSAALYNGIFGTTGNLQYLHDGAVSYFGDCIEDDLKFDILWESTVAASLANGTNTTINYDTITVGSEFYNANVVSSSLPGCALTSTTPMIFICSLMTKYAANATGHRSHRLIIGGTNITTTQDFSIYRYTTRSIPATNTTDMSSLWISYVVPTNNNATVTFTTQSWQNSGGALNRTYARLAIAKLPCT